MDRTTTAYVRESDWGTPDEKRAIGEPESQAGVFDRECKCKSPTWIYGQNVLHRVHDLQNILRDG